MKNLFLSLVALFAVSASAQSVEYRFDAVKRKVLLQGAQAAKGQSAHGGDKVTTGWFSYALIASAGHGASFEIFSATDVTLSTDTPGVILSLERGRIRAAFDKITGNEPRIVKTPGALLAVRGTEFDVIVDASGNTTVDVWEGIVEIQSSLQREPLFVRAGERSIHSPRVAPETRPMPEQRRREGGMDGRGREGGDRRERPEGEAPRKDPQGGGNKPPQPPPGRPPESK